MLGLFFIGYRKFLQQHFYVILSQTFTEKILILKVTKVRR